MNILDIQDDSIVYELHEHPSVTIPLGVSIVIFNNGNDDLFISQQPLAPTVGVGLPLKQGAYATVQGRDGVPIWFSGAKGTLVIQTVTEAISNFNKVDLPQDVWTSRNDYTRRLSVDVGETSFEEGREFYCRINTTLPASQVSAYKFVFTTDVIFQSTDLTIYVGDVKLEIYRGGTELTPFTVPVAILPANSTTQLDSNGYTTGTTKFNGGTLTLDGDLIETLRIKTDVNSNKSALAGGTVADRLGLAAGSYYFVFTNLDTNAASEISIRERWEEKPLNQYS